MYVTRCELLSDFVYSFFEHNPCRYLSVHFLVVNCFQILYIRSLNTISDRGGCILRRLWIAFRFCIFVLWTQWVLRWLQTLAVVNCFQILYIRSLNTILASSDVGEKRCELLSDFVYSFFEHNSRRLRTFIAQLWIAFRFCIFVLWTQFKTIENFHSTVVNCFQILYIRSLNTIKQLNLGFVVSCELLSDFVYSFFEHNIQSRIYLFPSLWIAFRFCIFVLWTQWYDRFWKYYNSCELLSDFVYSFFEHNGRDNRGLGESVVNCFQILYIRSLNTIRRLVTQSNDQVVNCFQILYIRSLNTIVRLDRVIRNSLWIAFRFCIFVLWTQ